MKKQQFIDGLSPVKKRIAEYLFAGFTPEQTAKKIAKENSSNLSAITAYVTMVENDAKAKKLEFTKEEKAPYSFDVDKNKSKMFVHTRVAQAVLASIVKKGIVLTLSWEECMMEKMLFFVYGLKGLGYLACEKDAKTFNQLRANVKTNKWSFIKNIYNGIIGDQIYKAKKDKFAHLFLDYCGRFNTFAPEITHAIKNKIVKKGGIVWITVSRPYETGTLKMLKNLVKQAGGNNYIVVFDYDYRDGMPMSTIIIKRIK